MNYPTDRKESKNILLQVIASIPKGKVSTYGGVAALAGMPRHARYVGTVLKNLPAGSKIPWHRVVNSKG
ncbi:MAG: MGMT family protein, partial [Ketobacter sp.]